jgi:ATP-dependent Clp protease ATP-binding subunit ClpA
VLEFLSAGFNTKFGARSLQNVVQKKVLPVLSRLGKEKETRDIHLSVEGESIWAKI